MEENRTGTFLYLKSISCDTSALRQINIARESVKDRKREGGKKTNTQNISTTPELR